MRAINIVFIIILVMISVGCSNTSTPILTKVDEQDLSNIAKGFIDENRKTNGLFHFSSVKNEKQYLIFNYSNATKKGNVKFLSSIQAKIANRTSVINIDEENITENDDERIGKLCIFEISTDDQFENIQLFLEGKETKFDIVGG